MGIESSNHASVEVTGSTEASSPSTCEPQGEPAEATQLLSHWIAAKASQLTPQFIRNRRFRRRFYESALQGSRSSDDLRNKETRLPSGESVCLEAIWVCETYGPDSTEKLKKILRELENSDRGSLSRAGYADWLVKGRGMAEAGFYQLPRIVRKDEPTSGPFGHVRMALPEGIEYIDLYLHSVTSSVTAIIACFVLDSEESRKLGSLVDEDHQSKLIHRKHHGNRSYSIANATDQKINSQGAWRKEKRQACSAWINKNLPGWFSRDVTTTLPSIELVTTQKCLAWDQQVARRPDKWVNEVERYGGVRGLGGW